MPVPQTPLINGQAYTWANIVLNIMGVPIAGVEAIEYEEKEEIVNNYGAGKYPVSRGGGKVEATAKLTLHMEEVEAITAKAPNRRLQSIPEFDIIVSYLPDTGGTIVTHKVRNVRFKNNNRKPKQGDSKVIVELELVPSHIDW